MVSKCVMRKLKGKHPVFFEDEDGVELVTFDGVDGRLTMRIRFIERTFCADF